jgi:hypothetical protein
MATMSELPERAEDSDRDTGVTTRPDAALRRSSVLEQPDPDRAEAAVVQIDPRTSSAIGNPPKRADGPPPARGWVQRSDRDRRARTWLEIVESEGVVMLNDRRIPGSKASIKLIAVAPAGVFVIDTKHYKGLVHTKRPGPMSDLGPDELHVGRRNCTPSVTKVARQVEAVRSALGTRPRASDVWVGWPKLLAARVRIPVVMDAPTVQEVSLMISDHLPTN